MKMPTFPTNENHASHCQGVLVMLLNGEPCDQFAYHLQTSYPLVDFRTRVSNLYLNHGWPIEREFHETFDFNGEMRRVKHYWLNQSAMQEYFRCDPGFKQRCMLFVSKSGMEGRS